MICKEPSIDQHYLNRNVSFLFHIRRVTFALLTLPLQYPPALDARYRIVPAISSSLPIRCLGTSSLGITPPVLSYCFDTAVVISDGNPIDYN